MRPQRLRLVRGPDGRVSIGMSTPAQIHEPPSRRALILPVAGARPQSVSCSARASVARGRRR